MDFFFYFLAAYTRSFMKTNYISRGVFYHEKVFISFIYRISYYD